MQSLTRAALRPRRCRHRRYILVRNAPCSHLSPLPLARSLRTPRPWPWLRPVSLSGIWTAGTELYSGRLALWLLSFRTFVERRSASSRSHVPAAPLRQTAKAAHQVKHAPSRESFGLYNIQVSVQAHMFTVSS